MKTFLLIGHVDHGKSTLGGQLLVLTGNIDAHDIEMVEKEAERNKMTRWKYAYHLDISEEERVKGKTHEYNTIQFSFEEEEYLMIDTPGHSSFVRSTIEAIGTYPDATVVCVVSAIPNEFVSGFDKGMIKEQIILARASGLKRIIVAVNKMDAVEWDDSIYEDVQKKMLGFLSKLNFEDIQYLKISAYEGQGCTDILKMLSANKIQKEEATTRVPLIQPAFKVKILRCDSLISPGFACIGHLDGKEYGCIIDRIKGKKFCRTGDVSTMKLIFDTSIPLYGDSRLVLRAKENYTIGFATPYECAK
jgi:selenocysteine-specific translation elongation factor